MRTGIAHIDQDVLPASLVGAVFFAGLLSWTSLAYFVVRLIASS
jgi:hypothetical protein